MNKDNKVKNQFEELNSQFQALTEFTLLSLSELINKIINIFGKKLYKNIPEDGTCVKTRLFFNGRFEQHHSRIVSLIDQDKVIVGGHFNKADRYIAPTVMKNVTLKDNVMAEEIFGSILVNPNLPFGGVGESGIGSYHGFNGFERFSHKKSILKAASWLDLSLIYPPYQEKINTIRRIMK